MLKFLRSLLLLPLLAAATAFATGQAFEPAVFDALRKQGKPVVVDIHASWCPTCRAQEPILSELLETPELKDLTRLTVDFDRQRSVVSAFKVQYQSTLIVFKGGREVGRSTGDTNKDSIAALLRKAL